MRRRGTIIPWAALGILMLASFLTILTLVRYANVRATFPTGLRVAGIPIGGLTFEDASERIVQVYMSPIELRYGADRIQVRPATLGFELKLQNMLAAADQQRTGEPFWSGFWRYMWNRPITTQDIPLQALYDDERINSYLDNEIAIRYDEPPTPPMPIPGESNFYPGAAGSAIDPLISLDRIKTALSSSTQRIANLQIVPRGSTKPTIEILDYMLTDIIKESNFDGLIEFYFKDLQTGFVIHFTHSGVGEQEIPVNVAFSSWSTIKIPALLTSFKYLEEPYDPAILAQIEEMVELSDNDSTDAVAKEVIDPNIAPITITEDVQSLGLNNTFWAGYFTLGSPLLRNYSTKANQRSDYVTDPDPYAQTTPLDMGLLLEEIYYCAQTGGGSIPLAFEGQITQMECQMMIDYLSKNMIGVLIQAGVPAGTKVAHKHGWAIEVQDGYMHTMADAGIVFTPGGDYILSVFVYHPVQLIYDKGNLLVSNLSSAVYNYFNLE